MSTSWYGLKCSNSVLVGCVVLVVSVFLVFMTVDLVPSRFDASVFGS